MFLLYLFNYISGYGKPQYNLSQYYSSRQRIICQNFDSEYENRFAKLQLKMDDKTIPLKSGLS